MIKCIFARTNNGDSPLEIQNTTERTSVFHIPAPLSTERERERDRQHTNRDAYIYDKCHSISCGHSDFINANIINIMNNTVDMIPNQISNQNTIPKMK